MQALSKDKSNQKKKKHYYVERIMDKQKINGTWKYLIKWKGYPTEQATWEPVRNLSNTKKMLKDFELQLQLKEKKKEKEKPTKITKEDLEDNDEKLKNQKKTDNSHFKKIETGSIVSESENESNILSNSQMNFKNNSMAHQMDNKKDGDFRLGDKPKKLLFARKTKNGILFAVEWEERKNGIIPEVSCYDNSQLKIYSPQILIDYYEDNIKFKDENKLIL